MAEGIQVEVADGFARIEFLDKSKRGETLRSLLDAGGPGMIDVDTSGTRKAYIVPESVAEQAGVIDAPKRRSTRTTKAKTEATS